MDDFRDLDLVLHHAVYHAVIAHPQPIDGGLGGKDESFDVCTRPALERVITERLLIRSFVFASSEFNCEIAVLDTRILYFVNWNELLFFKDALLLVKEVHLFRDFDEPVDYLVVGFALLSDGFQAISDTLRQGYSCCIAHCYHVL